MKEQEPTAYSEKHAELLDKSCKKGHIGPLTRDGPNVEKHFKDVVMSYVNPSVRFLDLCCGTGHFLQSMSSRIIHGVLAGIDKSMAMINTAKANVNNRTNILLLKGDVLSLPFPDSYFDVITCRMAPASIIEAYRVLDTNGWFIYKGAGPNYNPEIRDVFRERYTFRSYDKFGDQDWKTLFSDNAKKIGFDYFHIEDYTCHVYYNPGGLVEYLEMIPVVKDFNKRTDLPYLKEIAEKHRTDKGIRITRQFFLMRARK